MNLIEEVQLIAAKDVEWTRTTSENLHLTYTPLFPKSIADALFEELERTVEYYDGDLSKVQIFGKWHNIPRQQVAYGDPGKCYKFSGTALPAKEWTPLLLAIRDVISKISNVNYNFVLINRYRNGSDHIGEHRDGEAELDPNSPIASLSLGQVRDFVLKHADVRRKGDAKRDVPLVKLQLEHGSLLLMKPPTNKFWYHSLPPRKKANGIRLNLTFRKLIA